MKTLIFCFSLSLLIHIAILFEHHKKSDSDNYISVSSNTYVNIEIIDASQGKKEALDLSGNDEISQIQSNERVEKKTEKNIVGKKENIKKNKTKSEQKTAKKGSDGYQLKETYTTGYASYIPNPKYPLISRRNKEEGSVNFSVEIDETGKLIKYDIIKSSGYKRLDKEAEKALKAAKFQAALKNGVPVSSNFNLKITFTLEGQ